MWEVRDPMSTHLVTIQILIKLPWPLDNCVISFSSLTFNFFPMNWGKQYFSHRRVIRWSANIYKMSQRHNTVVTQQKYLPYRFESERMLTGI